VEVDFNVLRRKLIDDYNKVISALSGAICSDTDMDRVVIPVDDILMGLEKLRLDIVMIGSINDPSIKDCSCIVDENTEIKSFYKNYKDLS